MLPVWEMNSNVEGIKILSVVYYAIKKLNVCRDIEIRYLG